MLIKEDDTEKINFKTNFWCIFQEIKEYEIEIENIQIDNVSNK